MLVSGDQLKRTSPRSRKRLVYSVEGLIFARGNANQIHVVKGAEKGRVFYTTKDIEAECLRRRGVVFAHGVKKGY